MPSPEKKPRKKESRFVDFKAVKEAVKMEQVLAHYGLLDTLKRKQDSFSGICPIHQGKDPTEFRVSLSKNCWNCFSACHCGGNVLDFVAKKEDVELFDAAHLLIDWFKLDRAVMCQEPSSAPVPTSSREGGSLPMRETSASHPAEQAHPPAKKPETGINKPLGFHLDLDDTHPYLTERGLTPDTIEEFGLGFCAKGVMSDRIALPIQNAKGEIVGYAGRWPGEPPEPRPKYRLPDGFKKSVEVYRLAHAIHEPDGHPLVIVEGFFDVMKLWQLGVRKCVALMGSHLSEAQEALLVQHLKPTSQVIVMFDEDNAGRSGREDVLQRLARKAFVRVITFKQEGFQPEHLSAENIIELGLIQS